MRLKTIVFAVIPSLICALLFAISYYMLGLHRSPEQKGRDANELAWDASFTERNLRVPPDGPREGFWGSRLAKKVGDDHTAWREAEQSIPGMLEVDDQGLQHWRSAASPTKRVLIVGGSVAFGSYASTPDATYFAVAGRELEHRGIPIELTVAAAGAWKAFQEAASVQLHAEGHDLVISLSGINDLTLGDNAEVVFGKEAQKPTDFAADNNLRVMRFMEHVCIMADLSQKAGAKMLVVLQPSLAERAKLTAIEDNLLSMTRGRFPHVDLTGGYRNFRSALPWLVEQRGAAFFDASRVFDSEIATTFCDWCHFSDAGHTILGQALAEAMDTILSRR